MNPDIIYEDNDIIVCHKPAGTATQSSRIGAPDMVSILKNHIYRNSDKKKEPYLSVIHRLDQPVEGLLVFAKTPAATKELNRQLTAFGFGKYYRAILTAVPSALEGDLTDYLVKNGRTNMSKVCTKDTPGAKKALLHYKVTDTFTRNEHTFALAQITLETGRHHQIRVQMANAGCPIAGDRKYGNNDTSYRTLQLFACRLSFQHPRTKKQMEFTLDLPSVL